MPKDAVKNFTSSASPRERKKKEESHEGQGKKSKRGPRLNPSLLGNNAILCHGEEWGERRLYRVRKNDERSETDEESFSTRPL